MLSKVKELDGGGMVVARDNGLCSEKNDDTVRSVVGQYYESKAQIRTESYLHS